MNKNRVSLIAEAKQKQTPFWNRVADDLAKSNRQRRIVNLSRIDRTTKEGEVVIVPGKVLGDGPMTHKVTIAAYSFSASALTKLKEAKCTVMSIEELLAKNPKGSGRIIG